VSGGTSYFFGSALLDHILRGEALSLPSDFYLRLLTSATSKGVVGVETGYTGYQRLVLPRGTTLFTDAGSSAEVTNVASLEFPQADSAGAGDLVGFDIVDTAAGAFTHIYLWGVITPSRTVVVGKRVKFPAGSLIFTA
jgi:hypothetical protein